MSSENSQLAERPTSVKDYLAIPAYRDRFHEVMGKRANQFMAAIVASSQLPGLKDAEPRSVIAAAMVAATLDLPVNPTLGQAHLVAYSDGQGSKVAQFQIGYKGLIQLALRSGQYKRLNAGPISAGAFKGYDIVGEPIMDFSQNDPTKEAAGYFCAFETLNGFIKVEYWSKERAEAHAKRFSKSYAKGYSTPWKSDFDSMATKTVIKSTLGKWGLLSVEMQKAVVHDQGAQADVDSEVKYVDADEAKTVATEDAVPGDPRPEPPAPKKRRGLSAPEVVVPAAETGAAAPTDTKREPTPEPKAIVPEPAAVAPVAPDPVGKAKADKLAEKEPEPVKETPKAEAPTSRAFLNDKETLVTTIKVKEASAHRIKENGAWRPSIRATVSGGFVGMVYHVGAGEELVAPEFNSAGDVIKEGSYALKAPWAVGAELKVTILGKHNPHPKVNKVQHFVQAVEAVSVKPSDEEGDVF